ncbi:hypothetical protein IF1G_10424 [Cordyceps javanica]|uniref:Uncharacterized protein n=1 Tax=Cordyceps javanica TaxID=43265 RepID=A0A545UN66_9HYPO|nr:hypothetical protein IF1G_10424 [Cordyceps javanica]
MVVLLSEARAPYWGVVIVYSSPRNAGCVHNTTAQLFNGHVALLPPLLPPSAPATCKGFSKRGLVFPTYLRGPGHWAQMCHDGLTDWMQASAMQATERRSKNLGVNFLTASSRYSEAKTLHCRTARCVSGTPAPTHTFVQPPKTPFAAHRCQAVPVGLGWMKSIMLRIPCTTFPAF